VNADGDSAVFLDQLAYAALLRGRGRGGGGVCGDRGGGVVGG
jgi:hypothetical protein